MNQTIWIVGGGVLVIGLAVLLYLMTGDGLPKSTTASLAATSSDRSDTPIVIADTPTPPASSTKPSSTSKPKTESVVVLHTSMGDITLKLYDAEAPNTVNNFLKLARSGFYNGTKFHRIIADFMVQGGDPLSKDDTKMNAWGTGGPGYMFADEFNTRKLVRGSLAMANSGPNTNQSQFFIVTKASTPWLDGKHTNFGEVVSGMDVLMKMGNVPTENDRPKTPVILTSVEIK